MRMTGRILSLIFAVCLGFWPSETVRAQCDVVPLETVFGPASIFTLGPVRPSALASEDLNGDGIVDLVVSADNSVGLVIFIGDGSGGFVESSRIEASRNPNNLKIADVDGDGSLDILENHRYSSTGIRIYFGTGDGQFPRQLDLRLGQVADFELRPLNGDELLDLVLVQEEAGTDRLETLILHGVGEGRFDIVQRLPQRSVVRDVLLEDIDGDDMVDIITANYGSSDVSVYRGLENGRFGQHEFYPVRDGPESVFVFDVDSDGRTDIVSANSRNGSVSVLHATDLGGFERALRYDLPTIAQRVLRADLNGDGEETFVVLGQSALWSVGDLGDLSRTSPIAISFWESASLPDLNGDGLPDLLSMYPVSSRGGPAVQLNRSRLAKLKDCDQNGLDDSCEIDSNADLDVDANGILDVCQPVVIDLPADCDSDGVSDAAAIESGLAEDCNSNGVPDDCEMHVGVDNVPLAKHIDLGFNSLQQLVVADLDSDGTRDVVAFAGDEQVIAVLFGDGNFEFSRIDIALDRRMHDVAAGDLNSDGLLDLVVAEWSELRVYFGLPGRTFDEPIVYPASMLSPRILKLVDIDTDGLLDVVAASQHVDAGMVWWQGVGDGVLGEPKTALGRIGPRELTMADIDGDGFLDALVGEWNRDLSVFYGIEGGFEDVTTLISTDTFRAVEVHDFDEDGSLDLLLGRRVLWGEGERRFASGPLLDFEGKLRDVNGDGLVDLVGPNGGMSLALGAGGVTFMPAQPFAGSVDVGRWDFFDFDDDGDLDFVNLKNGLSFVEALAPGQFAGAQVTLTDELGTRVLAYDIDGDGIVELVRSVEAGFFRAIEVLKKHAGQFERTQIYELPLRLISFNFGDADGDGIEDMIVGLEEASGMILLGLGDGTFAEPIEFLTGEYNISWFLPFRTNGTLELLAYQRGELLIFRQLGDFGNFDDAIRLPTRGNFSQPVLADFDGDGVEELMGYGDGDIWRLVHTPAGFEPVELRPIEDGPPNSIVVYGVDMNLDGALDIVTLDGNEDAAVVFLNDGDSNMTHVGTFPGIERASVLAVADWNADRIPDAITASSNRAGIVVQLGQADGTFGEAQGVIAGGMRASRLLGGDFDGDGLDELLVTREGNQTFEIQLSGPLRAQDCNADNVIDECQLEGQDVDGNSILDTCEPDCDGNSLPDAYELSQGEATDCNGNGVPDRCDLSSGESNDVDSNSQPDECQEDCDSNGVPDSWDLAQEAVLDCNDNDSPDACDLASEGSLDVDGNGVPDECQADCDGDGVPDEQQIADGADDCDGDLILDSCQLLEDAALDIDGNGVLDRCEADCDSNGVPDSFDISSGSHLDCDGAGVPDRCELESGAAEDCDENGIPDVCDRESGGDSDRNGVLDLCEGGRQVLGDCNQDAKLDLSDPICVLGYLFLSDPATLPCGSGGRDDPGNLRLLDWQGDGQLNLADPIAGLQYIFAGGEAHHLASDSARCALLFSCPEVENACAE